MSEASGAYFEPTFNRSVKLRARDHRLSSNGDALLLRETDERLGLVSSLVGELHDPRRPELVRYHLDELLRERIYTLALGYNTDDEVDFLAHDPAMRMATWGRPEGVPLSSRLLKRMAKWLVPTTLRVSRRHRREWIPPPQHAFLVSVLRQ